MSGDQLFTLGEHLIIVLVLAMLVFVGPGKLKEIAALVAEIRAIVTELAKIQLGMTETTNGLSKLLPSDDTTARTGTEPGGPLTGPPRG